jgi:hypothetical protein
MPKCVWHETCRSKNRANRPPPPPAPEARTVPTARLPRPPPKQESCQPRPPPKQESCQPRPPSQQVPCQCRVEEMCLTRRCRFGMLLAAMKILDVPQSGSQAGTTASRNRFGQYRRTRAIPVNPNSAAQTAARSRLGEFSTQWRALTGAQRLAWASFASQLPKTDSLGQTYFMTGAQAFVSVNSTLNVLGSASVTTPPEIPSFPQLIEPAFTDNTTAVLDAEWDDAVGTGFRVLVRVSPPRSQGRGFEGDFRQVFVTNANAGNTGNFATAYAGRFGAVPVGAKIFAKLTVVSVTGVLGPSVIISTITVAPA